MKEQIVKFKRGPYPKKYTAIVKNKTHKLRKINLEMLGILNIKTVHH